MKQPVLLSLLLQYYFFQCFVLAGSVCVQILRFSKQGWLGLRGLFEQFGNDKDPMIAFDHGSHKTELDVRKGLIALGVTTQSILTDVLTVDNLTPRGMLLVPDQDSLQARRDYTKKKQ